MRTLYLDCGMGAAGDMLSAALLELLPEPEEFVRSLNALGIPGVAFARERSVKCGITGTHLRVTVHGEEEGHAHAHDHGHDHGNGHDHGHHGHPHEHPHGHEGHHHHSGMEEIGHIVRDHLDLSERVREDVLAVYRLIAQAESRAHGVPVEEIHFHEVGTMDAVADITAFCLLMDRLAPDAVVASPVCTGFGQVRCAHGILPVPAPATAFLLEGIPSYGGHIRGELCTPTGAALLRHFADRFDQMPVMRVERTGYGMGQKDFEAANCVRAMLGETETPSDEVCKLECNVDDMTGEAVAFAMERIFAAGAVEVFTLPAGMKKGRPGILLQALCHEGERQAVLAAIFRHTSTIGVRESRMRRHVLARRVETVETPDGPVRCKISRGCGVERRKLEHEDLAGIARSEGISLAEAAARAGRYLDR